MDILKIIGIVSAIVSVFLLIVVYIISKTNKMKKRFFSVSIIIILTTMTSLGQYRYSGQWAVHLSAAPTLNNGFNIQAGIEKYFHSGGSLLVNIDYSRYRKFVEITNFHVSVPTGSVLYVYSFDQMIRPPLFINLGAGISLGSEIFEKKKIPYGIVQNNGGRFIYGLVISPQFEYLINRRISCYFKPDIKYYFKSRFDNFIFCPGFGIKVYM